LISDFVVYNNYPLSALLLILLVALLMGVALFDLLHGIIPDWINMMIAGSGLLRATMDIGPSLQESILAGSGAIIAFGILREAYSRWRGCHGMGLGDVKFFGAAATWVGFQGLPTLVLIASISGLAFAIIRSLVGFEACRETRIAFGPHLSIGLAYICIFGSIE
jgi:leader peptidase (prepilin peptidase)/N-methyltransferase